MLEWLTTIPGILVLCGVILLIIAIILFIMGARKSKGEVVSTVSSVENNALDTMNSFVGVMPSVTEQPVVSSEEVVSDNVTVEPVDVASAEPVSVVGDFNMLNSQNDTANLGDTNNDSFTINIPSVEEQPIDMNNIETNDTAIYGGEVPTVDFSVQEEKPVTIYGGNDPLDATQTLPKMEDNHVPYGGSYPEVKIVEPTIQPVESTVVEMPIIEPVVISEPEVVSIPVQEPVVVSEPEVTSVPVEEPVVISEPEVTSVPVEEPVVVSEPEVVSIPVQEPINVTTDSQVEEL